MPVLADSHFRQVSFLSLCFHMFKSETKHMPFTGVIVDSKMTSLRLHTLSSPRFHWKGLTCVTKILWNDALWLLRLDPIRLWLLSCFLGWLMKMLRQPCGEVHMMKNWGFLSASEELMLFPTAMWVSHLGSTSYSQAFGRQQPQPTSWLPPHERPWNKTTQMSCYQMPDMGSTVTLRL